MPEIRKVSGPGGRHYIHPVTGSKQPGVTTILGVLDKPALVGWAARSVAEFAADNLDAVTLLGRDERVSLMKGAPFRKRDKAGDAGTEAHAYAEARLVMGIPANPQSRAQELVDAALAYLNPSAVQAEATIWNEAVGYAGTFDGIYTIDGRDYLIDWKSGSGIYSEVVLQLVAYARGEQIITADDVFPMPHIDGAMAIHVPEQEGKGSWSLHPVRLGEQEWLAFRACRALWNWRNTEAELALGQPSQKMEQMK